MECFDSLMMCHSFGPAGLYQVEAIPIIVTITAYCCWIDKEDQLSLVASRAWMTCNLGDKLVLPIMCNHLVWLRWAFMVFTWSMGLAHMGARGMHFVYVIAWYGVCCSWTMQF